MSASNKRVHFLPEKDTIMEIQSRKNYTQREIQDSWYTKSHLKELEQYTKERGERTAETISLCIDAVMDEQDAQWFKGEDDYDRFAVVSQRVSRFSVGFALLQAKKDKKEAQRVYESMLKEQTQESKKLHSKEPPTIVDDHTSVCSDLSHPEIDSYSFHSTEDSWGEMIESVLKRQHARIPAANNQTNNGAESSNMSRCVKNAKVLNKFKIVPRRSSGICK